MANTINPSRRTNKTTSSVTQSNTISTDEGIAKSVNAPQIPLPSTSDESVEQVIKVTSHRVEFKKTKPLDNPTIWNLLTQEAAKNPVNKKLFGIIETSHNESLRNRMATLLLKQNPDIARKLKLAGEDAFLNSSQEIKQVAASAA